MKSTLRYADNQYILTVDERPRELEWYYFIGANQFAMAKYGFLSNHPEWHRIIAAENIEGVMKIRFCIDDTVISDETKELYTDEFKQFTGKDINCEIVDNKVIIQL